jgi:hypothetical protein
MGRRMERPRKTTLAGGCLITLSIFGGVIWGALAHQSSIGFLAGLGIGLALSALVWLFDSLRR